MDEGQVACSIENSVNPDEAVVSVVCVGF